MDSSRILGCQASFAQCFVPNFVHKFNFCILVYKPYCQAVKIIRLRLYWAFDWCTTSPKFLLRSTGLGGPEPVPPLWKLLKDIIAKALKITRVLNFFISRTNSIQIGKAQKLVVQIRFYFFLIRPLSFKNPMSHSRFWNYLSLTRASKTEYTL